MQHLLRSVLLVLAFIGLTSAASAQRFGMPWMVKDCDAPYAPWGASAQAVLDTMAAGGAFDVSYDVVDGDTTITAKVGPRTRTKFFFKGSDGMNRIVMDMGFQEDRDAQRQHDIAILDLRRYYNKQLRFKMYDEIHLQKCGDYIQTVKALTGTKHGLSRTFQLTFERRPA